MKHFFEIRVSDFVINMKKNIAKIYSHRLRNLRLMVKLLCFAPFVRCVILNGSMAGDLLCHLKPAEMAGEGSQYLDGEILRRKAPQNDRKNWIIKPSSDIDILIIAKSGRIYTCRAAVLFWAGLSGLKRSSRSEKTHAGRFCFNYFLTENFLEIPHNRGEKVDKYCAENYSKSVLLWGDQKLFERFMSINLKWMRKYINVTKRPQNYFTERAQKKENSQFVFSRNLYIRSRKELQKIIEIILSKRFGNWLEYTLRNIQIKRIKKDPASKKYPKFIVFNDRELRFHHPKTK